MERMRSILVLVLIVCLSADGVWAQVGEYRSDLSVGVNGGVTMSSLSFVPKVPQNQLMGKTMGFTVRYVGEKYFKSVCAIVAEVNYAQIGWEESILTIADQPVVNPATGLAEEYRRQCDYLQIPLFARLGWGRERKGLQAFFQVGPQLGIFLNEKTTANFDLDTPNSAERTSKVSGPDIGEYHFSNMYHMPIENKFDYGIAGGLGLEYSHPKLGHILLDARYYYGLGNIYGSSKRDYFARSNFQNIVVKISYLYDIFRTSNPKIK